MRLWKFTDENDQTRGGMQWGENVTHGPTSGEGNLCAPGWLHAYVDLRLGVMVSPVHLSFTAQHLWEAEGEVGKTDGLKVGVRTLTTIRRVEPPQVTTEQRVRFAILCVKEVCMDEYWLAWASRWLSGADRSRKSATKAADAAKAAPWAAPWAPWAEESAALAAAAESADSSRSQRSR